MPSRWRPLASAPAQAAIAPRSRQVANENEIIIEPARVREIDRLASLMVVSTRRLASGGARPTVTISDVNQSNGVIHVADTVLMPELISFALSDLIRIIK